MKRLQIEWIILLVLVGVFLAKIPDVLALNDDAYSFFDTIVDVRTELDRHYVTEPDKQKMLESAVQGMIDSLDDPYTTYFSPEALASFDKQTRGTFSGIGAEITTENGHLEIASPLEDSPAFNAGLMAGDVILEIDGEPTEGVDVTEAVKRITGPEGSTVTLKVRHATGETVEVAIVRARIQIQTVKGFSRDAEHHWQFMLDKKNKIGYIRMTQFSDPTAEALAAAIDQLKENDFKGLILDLRFNPGGLLDQAIKTSDMFIKSGRIVSTRGRNSPERAWDAKAEGTLEDFPMVVLVNEYSASASEILSGALKDNNRARVVGTRSFGKGSVQQVLALQSGKAAVKVTTAHYYLPSGRNLHRQEGADVWGVDPSDGFYVPMDADEIAEMNRTRREADVLDDKDGNGEEQADVTPEWLREKRSDPQLAAALETIIAKATEGEWKPVGLADATLQAFLVEKRLLEKRKEAFHDGLVEINAKLSELENKIKSRDGDAEEPAETAATPANTPESATP